MAPFFPKTEEERKARDARNADVEFPHRCHFCGGLTTLETEGNYRGCYHCEPCGVYLEAH